MIKKYIIEFEPIEGKFDPSPEWFMNMIERALMIEKLSYDERMNMLIDSNLSIKEVAK